MFLCFYLQIIVFNIYAEIKRSVRLSYKCILFKFILYRLIFSFEFCLVLSLCMLFKSVSK